MFFLKVSCWIFPLKLNSLPLKNDGFKTSFLFGRAYFQGYVKLWGCIFWEWKFQQKIGPKLFCFRETLVGMFHRMNVADYPAFPRTAWTINDPSTALNQLLFNSSPLKIKGSKMNFLLRWPLFSCYISFRECTLLLKTPSIHLPKTLLSRWFSKLPNLVLICIPSLEGNHQNPRPMANSDKLNDAAWDGFGFHQQLVNGFFRLQKGGSIKNSWY